MHSAACLRRQIESALHARIPGALTPQPHRERDCVSTGIPEVDTLLDGGLPVGAITELVGPPCSGRSTLALAIVSGLTAQQKAVAWIDVADVLDPESAAAAGVDLTHQLWVRCGQSLPALSRPFLEDYPAPNAAPTVLRIEGSRTPVPPGGSGSPHPHSEVRGLSQAVGAVLRPGTPGAPNRKLIVTPPGDTKALSYRAIDREEQIAPERLPPRRGGNLSAAQIAYTGTVAQMQAEHCQMSGSATTVTNAGTTKGVPATRNTQVRDNDQAQNTNQNTFTWKPPLSLPRPLHPTHSLAGDPPAKANAPVWKALDQALRATDVLLATGGFSALVLDLGSTAPEFACRVPLATWFRLRAAAERTHTVFLLLTQHPCARSSAELVLRLYPINPHEADTVLTGANFRITVDRRRFESSAPSPLASSQRDIHLISNRKPVQRERATSWQRQSIWTHGGV